VNAMLVIHCVASLLCIGAGVDGHLLFIWRFPGNTNLRLKVS